MKQDPPPKKLLNPTTNRNPSQVNFIVNHCAPSKKHFKTSISVPGEGKVKKRMVKPETVTVVKSPATPSVSITEEALCDDILSCITALDEVIAEFDDSISQSSSSSLTSGSGGTTQSQKLPESFPGDSSNENYQNTPKLTTPSSSFTEFGPIVKIMEQEAESVRPMEIGNSSSQNSTTQFVGSSDQRRASSAPVKPARQSKKIINASYRPSSSPAYEIEPSPTGNSLNGNYMSYGIIFPKSTNTPSQIILENNNVSPIRQSPPNPTNQNTKVLESGGSGSSFPRVKSNKSVEGCRNSPKSSSSSPHKPIPVTFVMKPEDLGRFLENNTEEDWNCHIEKNLPRSLRKTRKTCFVEDDEEEQQKYCRSPKDFRKNLLVNAESKRSPLLNQRRGSIPVESEFPAVPVTTHWLRSEDSKATSNIGARTSNPIQISPPFHHVGNTSHNNNNNDLDNASRRNLNDEFCRKSRHRQGSPQTLTPPLPVTADQVLDCDDGYLSMINRHDAPILWPEGAIESETFTADELKKLSISKMNYLNGRRNVGSEVKVDDKADYFSDDSLEFEGDVDYGHQKHPSEQTEKMSSFMLATSSPPPLPVQPFINKSSTRKSWSPASEIRIPAKSAINTNTWRKDTIPAAYARDFDENQEDRFILQKKASSPVRKPCAFFIPMKSEIKEDEASKSKDDAGNGSNDTLRKFQGVNNTHSLDSVASQITRNALESGIREAAYINSLLATSPGDDEVNGNVLEVQSSGSDAEFVSVELLSRGGEESSINSSLGLSTEGKLSFSSERKEFEGTSSSSGIDYETSSEDPERNDFLEGSGYGPLEEEEEEAPCSSLPKEARVPNVQTRTCQMDDIEDLYENPPSFIPPPPQAVTPTPPLLQQGQIPLRSSGIDKRERISLARNSGGGGSDSDKDSFPENLPSTRVTTGERVLRTQRQTSRSHENLLDIDRKEYLPHPSVRRGHSATLPSNTVAPISGRRPSALQQFFGMFRRNKKHSNSSVLDLPAHGSPCSGKKGFERCLEDDSPQLPEHFSPYRSNRPSLSESCGSQRSNTSKTSRKRSVLSRIFRRKEK